MAIPFFSALGLGLRRAGQVLTGAAATTAKATVKAAKSVYTTVRAGVAQGATPGVIQSVLQKVGLKLPRPVVQKVITAERRRRAKAQNLKYLGRHRRPTASRLPLTLTPIAREYAFLVRVTGIDPTTGEAVEKWMTISTDELLTRAEIEERAALYFGQDPERYAIDKPVFQVTEGMRNVGSA